MRHITLWLTRPVHAVFFVSSFAIGVLAGVVAAKYVTTFWLASDWWYVVYGVCLLLVACVRMRWMIAVTLAVGVLVGFSRGSVVQQNIAVSTALHGSQVELRGRVAEDSGKTKSGDTTLRLEAVSSGTRPLAGEYWVTLSSKYSKQVQRSDVVKVRGTLDEGFGAIAGTMYRAELLDASREPARDPFVQMRDWLSGGIHAHIAEPEASLGAGFVLGQKQALPPDFEEALRVVGLTHVVVASGYNLTILVRLARRLFAKFSRYAALLSGAVMTMLFMGITGLSPSMTRAGLVAGLSLLIWYYGRSIHPLVLLVVVAAITVLIKPTYAWGDVGWLLSFTSFVGVMLLAPLLQVYFFGEKQPSTIRQIVGETISAQLLTMPIIIALFGTVSTTALLANVLVLPLVPLAMLLVFISGLAALLMPWLAPVMAAPTQWLLGYMTGVVRTLADLSWASFEVTLGAEFVIVSYLVIGLVLVGLQRRTRVDYQKVNIVE
jgi:competence protein ComEC